MATGNESTSARSGLGTLRVLVADDNRDCADSLGSLVTLWGYEVRVTYDGLTALEAVQGWRPDVALLDLGLPSLDGYQLAQQLRQQPALRELTLIAVTGHQWKDAHLRSREYGFDHHFVKPVDPDQLHALLEARRTGAGKAIEPVQAPGP